MFHYFCTLLQSGIAENRILALGERRRRGFRDLGVGKTFEGGEDLEKAVPEEEEEEDVEEGQSSYLVKL